MFKKIKENGYVQKFLEFWNIPRYRALIILGLYIIFFVFVIAYIRTLNSNKPINNVKLNALETYSKMDNYQYIATIKNENVRTFQGRVNDYKQIINFEENSYYYNGNTLYKKEDGYKKFNNQLLEFDIWRFTPLFINDLIKKGKLDSKTEFADGSKSKKYLVGVPAFIREYFNDDTESNDNISVTTFESNNKIFKVELDLSSVYHQGQYSNSYDYIVILEYSLIDQIAPIMINVESSD